MKKYIFLTVIFSVILTPAMGETPWLPSGTSCGKSDELKDAPSGLTAEKIMTALHPEPLIKSENAVESSCKLIVKEWKGLKEAQVVLYETVVFKPSGMGGFSEASRQVWIALYVNGNLIAKTEKSITLSDGEAVDSLDLAAYKLDEKTQAFGFRSSMHVMYAGGGGNTIYIRLFRIVEKRIDEIFKTAMSSEALTAGDWHEDGTRDHEENNSGEAVIQVLGSKTKGYFDWKKKRAGKNKASALLKWNGSKYELKGKDPVEDLNGD